MAEIEKFEGDLFWDEADSEKLCRQPRRGLDNVGEDNIVEFEQAKRLPNFFGVHTGGKDRFFTTLEEAQSAVAHTQEN